MYGIQLRWNCISEWLHHYRSEEYSTCIPRGICTVRESRRQQSKLPWIGSYSPYLDISLYEFQLTMSVID
jgi:hypothetical protein